MLLRLSICVYETVFDYFLSFFMHLCNKIIKMMISLYYPIECENLMSRLTDKVSVEH